MIVILGRMKMANKNIIGSIIQLLELKYARDN
jgi:hypothetical protein